MTARKATAKAEAAKGHVVTGALISVKVGGQFLQYSKGDILPQGVDQESLLHHLDLGLIAEDGAAADAESGDNE